MAVTVAPITDSPSLVTSPEMPDVVTCAMAADAIIRNNVIKKNSFLCITSIELIV